MLPTLGRPSRDYQRDARSGSDSLAHGLHGVTRSLSGGTQVVFTALKVALVVGFSAAALTVGETRSIDFSFGETEIAYLGSGAFAVSLIYVNYAYTGWNAATYLIDEVDEPRGICPKFLLPGRAS